MNKLAIVWALAVLGLGAGAARAGVVLRLGTVPPEGSRYMQDLRGIAEEIESLSGGEVQLKWYSGGSLGDEQAMMALVSAGKLDGGAFTDTGLSHLVPEMRVWTFPALFEGYDEVDYIHAAFKERFNALFEAKGVVLLIWGDVGFLHIFSDQPVATLAQLRQGPLWFWTDDPPSQAAAKLLQIPVVSTSLAGLVEGLKGGSIRTWQYPPMAAIAWGIHPYAKFISELRYRFMTGAIVVRRDAWDRLTADQQRLVRAVTGRWQKRLLEGWRRENEKAIAAMTKQGMKLVRMKDADRQQWFLEASRQRAAYAKQFGIEEVMRDFAAALQEFRGLRKQP